MKVLIELDDDMFKDIRKSDFDSARNIVRNFQATIPDTIRSGASIPDNATNGDIIKAMFNCMVIDITNGKVYVEKIYFPFDEDWWNSPYKGV